MFTLKATRFHGNKITTIVKLQYTVVYSHYNSWGIVIFRNKAATLETILYLLLLPHGTHNTLFDKLINTSAFQYGADFQIFSKLAPIMADRVLCNFI